MCVQCMCVSNVCNTIENRPLFLEDSEKIGRRQTNRCVVYYETMVVVINGDNNGGARDTVCVAISCGN